MSVSSVLDHIGQEILKIFTFGEKVATAAEPFVDIAFPQIGTLFNTTLAAVSNAQALGEAAAASGSTGEQKLANVITAISPTVNSTLVSLGVPAGEVNSTTVKNYVNAFVALLNTLPAPAPSTAVSTPAPVAATIAPAVEAPAAPVASTGVFTGIAATQTVVSPATPVAAPATEAKPSIGDSIKEHVSALFHPNEASAALAAEKK